MSETTLVTGATGAQGGAVARTLLDRGQRVRAVTRSAESPAAKTLAALGAEVVACDLSDVCALARAAEGCTRMFGVTNFWEHFGTEALHGKNIVDAARDAKIQHLVLSTLPSSLELSGGRIEVPHFESKATVERYARERGVPATFVHVAFYFENFISFFPPRGDAFGFPQGDTPLAGIAVEDLGPAVASIFANRAEWLGQTVGIVGEELTGSAYADVLSSVLDRKVQYSHVDPEAYAALGFPGAADLAAMFDLNRRFIPTRANDIAVTRSLVPNAQNFETWAEKNREKILAAMI